MAFGLLLFLILTAAGAVLVIVVGGLLGAFLGSAAGGIGGRSRAPEGGKELATYRGVVWGGCLGALGGLALATLLAVVACAYLLSL